METSVTPRHFLISAVDRIRGTRADRLLGDVHGEVDTLEMALKQLKARGVTHIIGTGDFVLSDGFIELEELMAKIAPMTGVQKDKMFLFPVNWEAETGYAPARMNEVLAKYGNLAFEKYDSHAVIEIGGEKIFVSHFPQFALPEPLLPPAKYRKRVDNQMNLADTIARGVHPPADASLAVYAHTHVGGAFTDPVSGVPVINPGVLNQPTKTWEEPLGFAIFTPSEGKLEFFDVDTGKATLSTTVAQLKSAAAGNRTDCREVFHLLARKMTALR